METTKTSTQLKQTAAQLLTLQEIADTLFTESVQRRTLIITIAQIFTTQVPRDQYDEFITYYDEHKQHKTDHLLQQALDQ
jgi:hypothetical protein